MLGFLWDMYQQGQIGDARRDAGRAASEVRSATADLRALEARIDQLSMVNMALWSILRERMRLDEGDLEKRVREIDLSDGQFDGKVRAPIRASSACGRTMAARHARCIYCGGDPVD